MITVLAGVNGAGKSSIGGSYLRAHGIEWFNPDEVARGLSLQHPEKSLEDINSQVWRAGVDRLEQAIRDNTDYAFETTLGGGTITNLLIAGALQGVEVSVWYCGLGSAAQHIERVAARAARGGHAIPPELVRLRYEKSMFNLCRLTPLLHALAVYDNSCELDGMRKPLPRRLLLLEERVLVELDPSLPDWAKPVATVVLEHFGS